MVFIVNLYRNSIHINRLKYVIPTSLCFFLLFTSYACSPDQETRKAVIFRVGDQVVTVRDIEKEVHILSIENGIPKNKIWSSINQLVNKVVDDSLILEYGKENGISLTQPELENAVQNIIKDYPDDSFDEMLLSRCIVYSEWKERFGRHLLIKKIVTKRTQSLSPISYQAVKSYYQEHKEDFLHPVRSKFMHIIAKTKKEAEVFLDRLKKGEDMKALVKEQSLQSGIYRDSGMDWKTKNMLPPALSDCIFSIPVGKISPIKETSYGFHIIKVLEREPAGVKGLLEVEHEIENRLRMKAIQREYTSWLQNLRNTYSVKIDHALLDKLRKIHEKN